MKKTLIILVMLVCFSIVYGHDDHEPSTSEIIEIAMSAAPANVSGEATIMSADGSILREGYNEWTCMPGTPPNDNVAPMCVDQAWKNGCKPTWPNPHTTQNQNRSAYLICCLEIFLLITMILIIKINLKVRG